MHHSPRLSTSTAALLGAAAFVCSLAGCSKPEEPTPEQPPAAPTSAEAIPAGVLGGKLMGEAFALRSAHYHIDRRPGFEKVEVNMSAGTANSPCAEPTPAHAAGVWLRHAGGAKLAAETVRLAPGEPSKWEVHYQVHGEHGWRGNGDASALLVLREIGADQRLTGELWACFADAKGSCVSGRFSADYCPFRLDAPVRGSEAMERLPTGHAQPTPEGGQP